MFRVASLTERMPPKLRNWRHEATRGKDRQKWWGEVVGEVEAEEGGRGDECIFGNSKCWVGVG